jgi:hypothetical protein
MLIKAKQLNLKMAGTPISTISPEKATSNPAETLSFLNMLLREARPPLGD